jgi:hypothetical protein
MSINCPKAFRAKTKNPKSKIKISRRSRDFFLDKLCREKLQSIAAQGISDVHRAATLCAASSFTQYATIGAPFCNHSGSE